MINQLILPHCCVCPKAMSRISNVIYSDHCYVEWFEVRDGCLFFISLFVKLMALLTMTAKDLLS